MAYRFSGLDDDGHRLSQRYKSGYAVQPMDHVLHTTGLCFAVGRGRHTDRHMGVQGAWSANGKFGPNFPRCVVRFLGRRASQRWHKPERGELRGLRAVCAVQSKLEWHNWSRIKKTQ